MVAKVSLFPGGFERKAGFSSARFEWRSINEVIGIVFPKATYDEVFLLLQDRKRAVEIGELDTGFESFEKQLRLELHGFPIDWRERVEAAGPDFRMSLWKKIGID